MSGVYIQGMKMPTHTQKAEIGIDADGHGILAVYSDEGEEPEIFEMISVPDHGLLMSADGTKEVQEANYIKFILDGCDISFTAEAPEDITLAQLLKQCDKIKPDWCACGIRSATPDDYSKIQLSIGYYSISKNNPDVCCRIVEAET